MNLNNYSFDDYDTGSNKKAARSISIGKIVVLLVLVVILGLMAGLYFVLKNQKEEEKSNTAPEGSFFSLFEDTMGNYYSYDFVLKVENENTKALMGDFLGSYYEGSDIYIEGTVFAAGAYLSIYKYGDMISDLEQTDVVINSDGIYASSLNFHNLDPNDTVTGVYAVKIADGMRGEDIVATLENVFENSTLNYGVTPDGTQGVSVASIQTTLSNPLAKYLGSKTGEIKFTISEKKSGENTQIEILGDGGDTDYEFTATPKNIYIKRPTISGTVLSISEYQNLMR